MKDIEYVPDQKNKPPVYLILTSSGGGGHTNAAEARKKELLDLKIPERQIAIIDLMGMFDKAENLEEPWVPSYSILGFDPVFSGKSNTKKWNDNQKEGTEDSVHRLENLVELQELAEAMQADDVRKNLLKYLREHNVQAIYNTQALSTPAICQAVVDYNKESNSPPLSILTTVTDLITHRADHFLNSLRNLTRAQKEVLKMEIAASPTLDPNEKLEDFYQKYGVEEGLLVAKSPLRMKNGEVVRENRTDHEYPSPVKQEYNAAFIPGSFIIKATQNSEVKNDESQYLKEKLGNNSEINISGNDITITKNPEDKLITITMGSQGSNSVIEYMDAFRDQLSNLPTDSNGNIYLCIAAGRSGEGSLYEKVKTHAAEIMKDLPDGLKDRVKILPLAFQDAKHMASLLNNSDVLISRSGGMSSMEAKATHGRNPSRQVYVHSEAKLKYPNNFPKHSYDATYEALMTGTVKWEGGNAEYLLREVGASLGSPETVDFGLGLIGERSKVKDNSLFHFAYDKKLNKTNLAEIEKLIREGSNPNLRFAGGSYLIDHCEDIETKTLLVKYGARITSLENNEKEELSQAQNEYKLHGSPLDPLYCDKEKTDKLKEQKAYTYLHPFEPKTKIERMIIGMDNLVNFIKSKILRIDRMHDALDAARMYLKTDPTEERSIVKRLRQLRNFAFDTTIFIAKQPVNMVIKPVALLSNIVKAGLISTGMLLNEAKGEISNICSFTELKNTGKAILNDSRDSIIAWGSAMLIISGFGTPVAFAIGGTTATISLGAANFGAANAAVASMNTGLVEAIAATSTPAASAVMSAEGVAEWGILRPVAYFALNPKRLFYTKESESGKPELNPLGKRIKDEHLKLAKLDIDIEVKRQAQAEIDKLIKIQKISKVAAPVLKKVVTPLKERKYPKRTA